MSTASLRLLLTLRFLFPAVSADSQLLVEKLSYADAPRPWKNPNFVSALPARTASGATAAGFKRNAKQLLTLERERIGGGDGFLSAAQTAAKARGEPIEPVKKKKKENPIGKPRSSLKGRRSGVATPMTIDDSEMSGTATPMEVDEDEEGEMIEDRGEVITCECRRSGREQLRGKRAADHRPHSDGAALAPPRQEVLRHHRPARAVHGPADEAALQGRRDVEHCAQPRPRRRPGVSRSARSPDLAQVISFSLYHTPYCITLSVVPRYPGICMYYGFYRFYPVRIPFLHRAALPHYLDSAHPSWCI